MLPRHTFPITWTAIVAALSIPTSLLLAATADPGARLRVDKTYGKLPLSFEANQGQTAKAVDFLSRGPGYTLFLTPTQAVLSLNKSSAGKNPVGGKTTARQSTEGSVLRMTLEGANPHPKVGGQNPLPGKVNYLIGKDPKGWRTGIPTYAKVTYQQVYPGIDLVYYGNQRQLEHDFVVAPGADPKRIRLSFEGAKQLSLDKQGNLMLTTDGGQVALHKPILYQDISGVRKPITGGYVLKNKRVSFQVAAWDRNHPLVIDPVLVYSTYLGGTGGIGYEIATAIAIDSSGYAYVAGRTDSREFPTTPGAFQTTTTFEGEGFVAKLMVDGSGFIYSTYLSGAGINAIALDSSGQVYITGGAGGGLPTTPGAFQTTYVDYCGPGCGFSDAFVTKLKADGSGLIYSTLLGGGTGWDEGHGIAVDSQGQAYVTGMAQSSDYPTTPETFQQVASAGGVVGDAFVTKLNASGSALVYSTYLGGSDGFERGNGIALGPSGEAFVAGMTFSTDFPTTPGAFQSVAPTGTGYSNRKCFISKFKADGSDLLYSTYLGGNGRDCDLSAGYGGRICLDSSGQAYVSGLTSSSDFPTTPGAFQTVLHGGSDAFITKLKADGSGLVYSTYLGGTANESGTGIALDSVGHAYVTGGTESYNFPTTLGAFQTTQQGSGDAFVTKLKADGSALIYSTYLGGNGGDFAYGGGVAVNSSGQVFVSGHTKSSSFPITPGAFQTILKGGSDAFVTKLWPSPNPYCAITSTGTDSQGRKYIKVTTQDTDSGLASINVTNSANASVSVPSFSIGTNDPVVVTATKINPSQASVVALEVRNQAGYLTACDPVQTEVIRTPGISTKQVFRNIPQSENQLDIDNGTPGLQKLLVIVNGQKFKVKQLQDGEKRTLNLSSAMEPGSGNTVKLKARGKQGGTASILLRDEP